MIDDKQGGLREGRGCVDSIFTLKQIYICIYGFSDEGDEDGDGRGWRLSGLLYTDDLVLCDESEEDLRVMVKQLVEVCRRRLKVNAGKSKVMVINGEEVLECEVHIDGIHLEHSNIWDVFWMN